MIYFTGDIHGNAIDRFSTFSFNKNDIIFVLGDCGIPWGNRGQENDIKQLSFLSNYDCTFIFIAGNHDNYDIIETMPLIENFNGKMRQMLYNNILYDNIFYIDIPDIFIIENEKYLIIPGAESHDIYNGVVEKDEVQKMLDNKIYHGFRINHYTWWEQEKIKQQEVDKLIDKIKTPVDFILSHDYPGIINNFYARPGDFRRASTQSQLILDKVRKNINYKIWLHGHIHEYLNWKKYNIISLYYDVLSKQDITQLYNKNVEYQVSYYETLYEKREKWNQF